MLNLTFFFCVQNINKDNKSNWYLKNIFSQKKDNRNDPIISKRIFYLYHSFVSILKSDKF